MNYLILVAAIVLGTALALNVDINEEFERFKNKYGKSYESTDDEEMRKDIFIKRLQLIESHNAKYENGEVTFKMGINQFTDLLSHEVPKGLLSLHSTATSQPQTRHYHQRFGNPRSLPDKVDWREKGVVTPVKDQGDCGSCWAFSTTGVLESHWAITHGSLISLSEQQLVDCTRPINHGCNGGYPLRTLEFIKNSSGIESEEAYPYTGQDGNCQFNKTEVKATVSSIFSVPSGDEKALQAAVANYGPVSVAIEVDEHFANYVAGVLIDPICHNGYFDLDHAVLVVGYGTESGQDYWLVKNSWGKEWGDNGYIKMARNHNNMCGIATDACFPNV